MERPVSAWKTSYTHGINQTQGVALPRIASLDIPVAGGSHMKQIVAVITAFVVVTAVGACVSTTAPNMNHDAMSNLHGPSNGSLAERPVFYDGELFTVNMMELSDDAAEKLDNNQSVNEIYAYADLDDPQPFNSVIDAVPGDGMNPLWEQELIVFNPGFAPHQFFSDVEVEEAAEGANPEITLVETEEIYRCSVVQQHSAH
jgi:hypothetical protein